MAGRSLRSEFRESRGQLALGPSQQIQGAIPADSRPHAQSPLSSTWCQKWCPGSPLPLPGLFLLKRYLMRTNASVRFASLFNSVPFRPHEVSVSTKASVGAAQQIPSGWTLKQWAGDRSWQSEVAALPPRHKCSLSSPSSNSIPLSVPSLG